MPPNDYYNAESLPTSRATASAPSERGRYGDIAEAFGKLPDELNLKGVRIGFARDASSNPALIELVFDGDDLDLGPVSTGWTSGYSDGHFVRWPARQKDEYTGDAPEVDITVAGGARKHLLKWRAMDRLHATDVERDDDGLNVYWAEYSTISGHFHLLPIGGVITAELEALVREAEAARDAAEGFRDSASDHADTALDHANAAAGSATTAGTRVGEAETARDRAEMFRDEAEQFRDQAQAATPSPNPLPAVTATDNSRLLQVVAGVWAVVSGISGALITSGTVAAARIADLDAAKIASGVLDIARIPVLTAAKLPALTAAMIPNLNASKITSGVFAAARIPEIAYTRLTASLQSRILPLPGGTANAGRPAVVNTAGDAWEMGDTVSMTRHVAILPNDFQYGTVDPTKNINLRSDEIVWTASAVKHSTGEAWILDQGDQKLWGLDLAADPPARKSSIDIDNLGSSRVAVAYHEADDLLFVLRTLGNGTLEAYNASTGARSATDDVTLASFGTWARANTKLLKIVDRIGSYTDGPYILAQDEQPDVFLFNLDDGSLVGDIGTMGLVTSPRATDFDGEFLYQVNLASLHVYAVGSIADTVHSVEVSQLTRGDAGFVGSSQNFRGVLYYGGTVWVYSDYNVSNTGQGIMYAVDASSPSLRIPVTPPSADAVYKLSVGAFLDDPLDGAGTAGFSVRRGVDIVASPTFSEGESVLETTLYDKPGTTDEVTYRMEVVAASARLLDQGSYLVVEEFISG